MGGFFDSAAQNGPNTVVFSSRHWEDRYEANRSASISYLFLFYLVFYFFLLQFFIFLCFICLEFWQFVAQGLFWSNTFAILDASCTLIGIFFFSLENFSFIISLKIFSRPLSWYSSSIPIISTFHLLICCRIPGYLVPGNIWNPYFLTNLSLFSIHL